METVTFKDGTTGLQGFDRLVHFDPRSRNFRLQAAHDVHVPETGIHGWDISKHLDQGAEGACVGAGLTAALIAHPFNSLGLDMQYAKERVYWAAQLIDPWPGSSMPGDDPFYEGTAVLAGLKILKELGWIDWFNWTFSLNEFISGVANVGPAIVGFPWYEGMMKTDSDGFIWPTGKMVGGHCSVFKLVDCDNDRARLHNSWGEENFGENGDAWMTFDSIEELMNRSGEVAFIGRY